MYSVRDHFLCYEMNLVDERREEKMMECRNCLRMMMGLNDLLCHGDAQSMLYPLMHREIEVFPNEL